MSARTRRMYGVVAAVLTLAFTLQPGVGPAAVAAPPTPDSPSVSSAALGAECPCTIWPPSVTPEVPSAPDPEAVELGVKFNADVDGFVTGVRFYKGSQNTGTHTGNLWSASGQRLATATFSNETATGWQEVAFDAPVQVTANTTYVASYHTTSGGYAASVDDFVTAGVDNPPLHALATDASGGNGVYAYSSASTFPSSSWRGTNYWVDVAFVTSTGPDTTAPTVTSTSPEDSATDVATNSRIRVTFSEALDPASVSGATASLTETGGAALGASVTYDAANRTVVIEPDSFLTPETEYQVTIKGGGSDPRIKDAAGNALAADKVWTFTTAALGAECPCTIWPPSVTPEVPSAPDPEAVELGVKFNADVDGFVTGVRFYKGSQNTGTHTGNLWSASGQRLATATFSNETATGWQEVAFDAPVQVTANTTYVASYHTTSGGYAASVDDFVTAGVDNPPLHALATDASGGNGVYAYSSASTFPSSSWRGTNYWVDVAFVTSTGPDTTAPTVTSTSPEDSATDVATNSRIRVTFSEALDPASVSGATASLTETGGAALGASVTYDAANRTVVIEPDSFLTPETEYQVTIKGGGSDPRIKDAAGNALAADKVWTFTTAALGAECPCTIWPPSVTPEVPSAPDPEAVELGVKFNADVDGFVTGVRFYKGSQNTGTHTGNLWSASGQRLATATFSNETATGWQEVAFDAPVQVTANTTYVASYHTTSGGYAASVDDFVTAGVDNPPLHALATDASGGNGVYAYSSASTFPSSSWRGTNYWVDVAFVTSTGPDTTAPTVTSTSPEDSATDVATNSRIRVTFSEALDPASVSGATASLTETGGAALGASVTYDAANRTVVIEPDSFLTPETEYQVTIKGGGSDPRIKDAAGNALAADKVWTFTTAAPVRSARAASGRRPSRRRSSRGGSERRRARRQVPCRRRRVYHRRPVLQGLPEHRDPRGQPVVRLRPAPGQRHVLQRDGVRVAGGRLRAPPSR